MPATPARAEFISKEFRIVKFGPEPTIVSQYGEAARRSKEPQPSFLESEADAQIIVNGKGSLLAANRMRMEQSVAGASTGLSLNYTTTTPTVQVIDAEFEANFAALIGGFTVEFEKDTTKIEDWG